ncbi:hypothetical protein D3C81_145430 [compost metagenome]
MMGASMLAAEKQPEIRFQPLRDYIVERMLLDMTEAEKQAGAVLPKWRQQVQYAVGHTLNDFYSLTPDVRRQTPIQFILEHRWPSRSNAFSSLLHYWEVKNKVMDSLIRAVSYNRDHYVMPVKLYEDWHVAVPELGMDLSVIFQLVWQMQGSSGKDGLIIQKFMTCRCEEVAEGFYHMVNVFCHKAYGKPPERVELFFLMEGEQRCYPGDCYSLEYSLDYLRLLSVLDESPDSGAKSLSGNTGRRGAEEVRCRQLLI